VRPFPRPRIRRCFVWSLAALLVGVTVNAGLARVGAVSTTVEAEVRAFMQGYGDDLRLHRREALVDRRSRRGAFFPSGSSGRPLSFEAIGALYRDPSQCKGPDAFEWRDLLYEVLGSDAVVVAGAFLWREASKPEATEFSYSNLLVREAGRLRIRVEHEAAKARK
jgi:hypothetical protein